MAVRSIVVDPDKCVRCYRCQVDCSFAKQKAFNPEEAYVKIDWDSVQEGPHISFTPECDGCGVCVSACVYGCLTLPRRR